MINQITILERPGGFTDEEKTLLSQANYAVLTKGRFPNKLFVFGHLTPKRLSVLLGIDNFSVNTVPVKKL